MGDAGGIDPPTGALRIGDVARLAGTTPRTIRYYEELGLLAGSDRPSGQHRVYQQADVERLQELLRLKDLLGLSLEQVRALIEAGDARAVLRRELKRTEDPGRRREIMEESLGHLGRQLELVRLRRKELTRLEEELIARRRRVKDRLRRL